MNVTLPPANPRFESLHAGTLKTSWRPTSARMRAILGAPRTAGLRVGPSLPVETRFSVNTEPMNR